MRTSREEDAHDERAGRQPHARSGPRRKALRTGAVVTVIAFSVGVLTAYAQGWLPAEAASLANSSGSWAVVAFLLALAAAGPATAAAVGVLSLLMLLAGYVVGADVRGYPSSDRVIVFWIAAAVVAGPLLGVGASWVRHRGGRLGALGAGAISGVLLGEGVYLLVHVAETAHPANGWGAIAVGAAVLAGIMWRHLPRTPDRLLAAATAAATAGAFVLVYSQNLLGLL